jgi:hypothetical protein
MAAGLAKRFASQIGDLVGANHDSVWAGFCDCVGFG